MRRLFRPPSNSCNPQAIALVALHRRGVRQRCTEKLRVAAAQRNVAIVVLMSEKAVTATVLTILFNAFWPMSKARRAPADPPGVVSAVDTPVCQLTFIALARPLVRCVGTARPAPSTSESLKEMCSIRGSPSGAGVPARFGGVSTVGA